MTGDRYPFRHGVDPRTVVARLPPADDCHDTSPRHNISFFQAQRLNEHPELWLDVIVSGTSDDGSVQGILVDSNEMWFARHHRSLLRILTPGTPVQLQPSNSAL